ncbi:hypothetical protein ACJX0J_039989, partial [Zea mays]
MLVQVPNKQIIYTFRLCGAWMQYLLENTNCKFFFLLRRALGFIAPIKSYYAIDRSVFFSCCHYWHAHLASLPKQKRDEQAETIFELVICFRPCFNPPIFFSVAISKNGNLSIKITKICLITCVIKLNIITFISWVYFII